jgi:predicted RNA-binding Zn-ribbon protein involved in translation (DUF1610 family)
MKNNIDREWKQTKLCISPYHNPPSMIVIPMGKSIKYKCPSCGKETVLTNNIEYTL